MTYALLRARLVASLVLASSAAWATLPDLAARVQASAASGEIVQQRKDVNEVSRPKPANGPSTPPPSCNPSSPDCP